jgi:MFS family permease
LRSERRPRRGAIRPSPAPPADPADDATGLVPSPAPAGETVAALNGPGNTAAGAVPLDRITYVALAASAGLSSIQFWMTVPLAALVLAERSVAPWQIGLIGAVPWIALMLLIPLVPHLAARFRAMPVYRTGCWLGLAGAVAFAAGDALWMWIVGYGLCGAGIALRWIVSDALIAVLSPPSRRGARVGLFEAWIGATMAVGPMIIALAGIHGPVPYAIGVALAALALPPALLVRVPAADVPPVHGRGSLRVLAAAIRRTPGALVAAGTCGVIEGAATKMLPVQAYGLGMAEALAAAGVAVFGAGNILTQYPAGRLADRLTGRPAYRRLLLLAFAGIAAMALTLPSAASMPPVWFALLAAIGGFSGALYTLAVFEAGHAGSAIEGMAVVAGISLAYTLGSTLGAPLAGAALSADITLGLPLALAAAAIAGLALVFVLGYPCRERRPRRYADQGTGRATRTGGEERDAGR